MEAKITQREMERLAYQLRNSGGNHPVCGDSRTDDGDGKLYTVSQADLDEAWLIVHGTGIEVDVAANLIDPHRILDPGYMEAYEAARRRQKLAAITEDWAIEGDGMISDRGYRSAIEAHAAAQRISRERQLPIFGDPEKCAEDYPLLYERVRVLALLDASTFAAVAGYRGGQAI